MRLHCWCCAPNEALVVIGIFILSTVLNLEKSLSVNRSKRSNIEYSCFKKFFLSAENKIQNCEIIFFVLPKRVRKKLKRVATFFSELKVFVKQEKSFLISRNKIQNL